MSFSDAPDFDSNARDKDNAIPEFALEPVEIKHKSEKAGHPVFEDVEVITIRVPGDLKTEWHGLVKEEHRRRFPRAYAAFKSQQEVPTEGTPLTEWPAITRGQAKELVYANVKTVEQLAELPDDLLNKSLSMGGFALRDKARRFLKVAEGNAPTEALAAENAELKAKMDAMATQFADMKARVDAMAAQKAGGPE